MAETGDAGSDSLARLAGFGSYVCSKMNYHEYCSHEYTGIHSALHRVLEEKQKVEQEHKGNRWTLFLGSSYIVCPIITNFGGVFKHHFSKC